MDEKFASISLEFNSSRNGDDYMGKSRFDGAHKGWQDFNDQRSGLKTHLRKIAFLFTCSFVVCGLFFAISNPPVIAYLLFLDVIWGAVFLCTKRAKNRAFLHSCVGISLASACALCAVKLAWGHSPRYPTIWEGILLGLALLVHLFALRMPETLTDESDLPKLYPRRKYDYERVKMYVTNFSMVGINAPWGTGKSFVVDQLKRDPDFLKEFELISIDLLTCDLDQVERIIIEELDKVFRKHYIHSAHSFRLKGLIGKNQWSNLLWGILGNEGEGIAASLQGFQKELRKLDKKILLIFDDLDRISETNTTKKIFAIAEKIACDHLHVVYQYDISALLGLGFEIEYLEKYLPYSVTLTQIPYKELVEQQWKDIMPKNISIAMKSVQSIGDGLQNCSHFSTLLGLNLRIQMDLNTRTTPRKMENFLTELKEMVATNPALSDSSISQKYITAVFLKHFYSSYFCRFQINESPMDTMQVTWEGENQTLPQVLEKFAQHKKEADKGIPYDLTGNFNTFLADDRNRDITIIALLLGYEFGIEILAKDLGDVPVEPIITLKKMDGNEKIDRVIWHTIANGTSELTDKENAIRKFKNEVLCKSDDEQDRAWNAYWRDMYDENLFPDNRSIFLLGIGSFFSLFQAMEVCGATEDEWKRLLDFYIRQYQKGSNADLTVSVIDCLGHFPYRSPQCLLQMIRFFNQLEIIANFNHEKSFYQFLQRIVKALYLFGFVKYDHTELLRLSSSEKDPKVCLEEFFSGLITDLEKSMVVWVVEKYDVIVDDFNAILEFVRKNQELISCEKKPGPRGPQVTIREIVTKSAQQEEIDRLIQIKKSCSEEQFQQAAKDSYSKGTINLRELQWVINGDQKDRSR